MKVKILRGYLNKLPPDFDDKEVTILDYNSGMVYDTPKYIEAIEDEAEYLVFIFKKKGGNYEYRTFRQTRCNFN